MRLQFFLAFAAVTLSACGGDSAEPLAGVYKSAGSVQCSGGGTSLAALQRQLADAGIVAAAAGCGLDGKAYPALCGAPDGRIFIFDIRSGQVPAAAALGFAPLDSLPSASRTACPA